MDVDKSAELDTKRNDMALYAFDGTWNSATVGDQLEQDDETNVPRFYEAYDADSKWYVSGPGTRFGKIGRVLGGATGLGAHDRVSEAYKKLCENWAAGDKTIDVVGFSRGAAIALDFVNKIEDNGIRKPGTRQVIEEKPQIRFLGLWDTVGSFGIPINAGAVEFQKINFGHKLGLCDNIEYCFHAIALDERRQTFRVTRLVNAYEVWFRGVHSDVGGGNGNRSLSCIPLRWMLRKAKAAGLPIKNDAISCLDANIDAAAKIRPSEDLIPNEFRGFLKGDRFHHAVSERVDHNNPPNGCARETEAEEVLAARLKRGNVDPQPMAA